MALALPQLVRDYAEIDLTRMGVDSRITFTRASTRTYFDASGVLRTAAINEWPLEYDPATGVCLGRSTWLQRTNMTPRSEDITNAGWTKNGVTATSGFSAPDGSTTACLIQGTNSGGAYIRPPTPSDYGSNLGVVQSYTIFVKAAGSGNVIFYEAYNGWRVVFNPSTGMITSQALPAGGTAIAVACGNGWYRIGFTLAKTAIYMVWFLGLGGAYPPGPSSQAVYAWGAQSETGPQPSPYIPTTTVAMTRSLDVAVINSLGALGFNPSEGTLVTRAVAPAHPTNINNVLWALTNGTAAERIQGFLNTGNLWLRVDSGGSTQVNTATANAAGTMVEYKAAHAYKLNDYAFALNGGAVVTDTVAVVPAIDRLRVASRYDGNEVLNGYIKSLRYYPRRMSNAELQALTA